MHRPAALATIRLVGLGLRIGLGLGLAVGLVACGGDDDDLAAADPDAVPPADAEIQPLLSALDAAGLRALCQGAFVDPAITEGSGNLQCLGEDCGDSPTAVEDCAAKTIGQPFDCDEFAAEDPFATCDQPVTAGQACLGAYFGQYAAYAAPTCENAADLPAFVPDPALLPGCQTLVDACPEAF